MASKLLMVSAFIVSPYAAKMRQRHSTTRMAMAASASWNGVKAGDGLFMVSPSDCPCPAQTQYDRGSYESSS